MPRRDSPQMELFEAYLFQTGAIRPYLRNIRELARMLPPAYRDVAAAIDKNAVAGLRQISRSMQTHGRFADTVGYKHLRKESK